MRPDLGMRSADPDQGPFPDQSGCFATTHWSVVLKAGDQQSSQALTALEKLCGAYWYPLYAFIRRSGHDIDSAKDLTQGFFERFLERNYLKDVDRDRGRFRSFLLASVKHYLANEWDRRSAQRRGGGIRIISLDAQLIETCERQDSALVSTPEEIFERRWALSLLDAVHRRLQEEYAAAKKAALFDAIQIYLSGQRDATPYAELGPRLNMSVDAVKKAVQRMRRRYAELLREEIAQTVANPAEIEDEIRCLRAALSL